jgi:starvation-inducible outer membrane lipoprotein
MKTLGIFALGLVAALAGCSAPPVLINGSAQGVVVRYSQTGSTSADATAAAQKFCARYGRKAVQTAADVATGDTFVSYTCEQP